MRLAVWLNQTKVAIPSKPGWSSTRAPHRSVRAELPHTAPTSSTWRQSEHWGMGGLDVGAATTDYAVAETAAMSIGVWRFDCAGE